MASCLMVPFLFTQLFSFNNMDLLGKAMPIKNGDEVENHLNLVLMHYDFFHIQIYQLQHLFKTLLSKHFLSLPEAAQQFVPIWNIQIQYCFFFHDIFLKRDLFILQLFHLAENYLSLSSLYAICQNIRKIF